MRRSEYIFAGRQIVLSALMSLAMYGSPCQASDGATTACVVKTTSISSVEALRIAQLGIAEAKKDGRDVAVVVSAASGLPLVMLRTDSATEQFVSGATRKAWTAINFRASTKEVFKAIRSDHQDDSQLPMAKKALFLYGGEPIRLNGTVIGGVGVAGFVDGEGDARVAKLVADAFKSAPSSSQ